MKSLLPHLAAADVIAHLIIVGAPSNISLSAFPRHQALQLRSSARVSDVPKGVCPGEEVVKKHTDLPRVDFEKVLRQGFLALQVRTCQESGVAL